MSESKENEKIVEAQEVVEPKVEEVVVKEVEVVAEEVEEVAEEVAVVAEEVTVEEAVTEEAAALEEVAEEVVAQEVEVIPSMDEFENEIEASMSKVETGDIVECKIITLNEDEVIVSLGYVADGLIKKEDLHVAPGGAIADTYNLEDVLKAEVLTMNDGEGNVLLSVKKADQIIVWDEFEAAFKDQTRMTVTISDVVKGGVVANVKGVRAFMPASMLSVAYVDDLNTWKGKELKVIVKDFDREDRKVIISHKDIDREEREVTKKAFFAELKKDQVFNGTVKKLMNFGAFIDLGGVDGLLHINEMSWKRIKHPSDIMKEGDVVEVYIIDIDLEKEKLSLGLKNIGENPWDDIFTHYSIGKVYEGEVVRLANFGAFVRIGDGIDGLVHISEISHDRIKSPDEVLSEGDKVSVKIMTIDKEAKKIGLSIKEIADDADAVELANYATDEVATTSLKSVFGDIMKQFEDKK